MEAARNRFVAFSSIAQTALSAMVSAVALSAIPENLESPTGKKEREVQRRA